MKFVVIIVILFVFTLSVPSFAQEMEFYENSRYEFSFNAPADWKYLEDDKAPDETLVPVILYPDDFSFESLHKSDVLELPFVYQSPQISVLFENVSIFEFPKFNNQYLEEVEVKWLKSNLPNAEFINLKSESRSWGWIVSQKIMLSYDLSSGETIPYISEGKTYYFKDRDSYGIGYVSPEEYFDSYHPVFENVIETLEIKGIKVSEPEPENMEQEMEQKTEDSERGGCLIATATYGSELSPQVQILREIRDNSLLQTESGQSFMQGFNQFYYSFSPTIAEWEQENPAFKQVVKTAITPLITSLSLLNYVNIDSEAEVLGYGISLIILNLGMYLVAPAMIIWKVGKQI